MVTQSLKDKLDFLKKISKGSLRWRLIRGCIRPSLSGVLLSRVDLSESDLSNLDLSEADLSGANLSRVDLSNSDLSEVNLSQANLSQANLSQANLSQAWMCGADLSEADLSEADLSEADLSGADLSGANLTQTTFEYTELSNSDLSGADLSGANFSGVCVNDVNFNEVSFIEASFSLCSFENSSFFEANFRQSKIEGVDFKGSTLESAIFQSAEMISFQGEEELYLVSFDGTNLLKANFLESDVRESSFSSAILQQSIFNMADLSSRDFSQQNLREINLSGADLSGADLSGADLSGADLSGASLVRVQALGTNFTETVFTSACLENWNINSATKFDGVVCECVYLKANQQERRPREGIFKLGEFSALFQQALDTVDLIFRDGIDWQAFFQSFQELRSQYIDQDPAIQAIERKQGGAFVVRLEVAEGADKPSIESSAKELYETKLKFLEQRYRAELKAKDGEISAYKQQSANLMKITELLAARPPMTEETTFNLQGANVAGAIAKNIDGKVSGGTINIYGPKIDDINRLITALRESAQSFPTEQKDDVLLELDALKANIHKPQPDPKCIGRRLKRLAAIATMVGTIATGTATFSGDLNNFASNVIELTETLGIPIKQVQLDQIPPVNKP